MRNQLPASKAAQTYKLLAITGALLLGLLAPVLLGGLGLLDFVGMQALGMLIAIWIAIPALIFLVAAVFVSARGAIRGPTALRKGIGLWWGTLLAGLALTAPLDVSHQAVAAAIGLIVLGVCATLPWIWYQRERVAGKGPRNEPVA